MGYYMGHTNESMYSDDVANYIAEKLQEQNPAMTDDEMEKIANEIYVVVEKMNKYEDSKEFYGHEVWTAENPHNDRTCILCEKKYCNCDYEIDVARGK